MLRVAQRRGYSGAQSNPTGVRRGERLYNHHFAKFNFPTITNEKLSDRISRSVAYAQHCFGSRRPSGIGQSKPFTPGHGRSRARRRPKSGDGHHA